MIYQSILKVGYDKPSKSLVDLMSKLEYNLYRDANLKQEPSKKQINLLYFMTLRNITDPSQIRSDKITLMLKRVLEIDESILSDHLSCM